MKNETRILFDKYVSQVAQLNGVTDPTKKFAIEPSVEQKLEKRVQEQADFLGEINVVPVDEITGEKLGLGTTGPIASRTNTNENDRVPRDIHDLDDRDYLCKKTDFDTLTKYATIDMWAKFPEFQNLMRDNVIAQIARDRMMIGFNGTSHAVETDFANNKMLEDVNIGWLQHMRAKAPQRVLSGLKIGDMDGADYKNIDAAVFDLVGEAIDPWHRESTGLQVITGRSLIQDKYLSLVDSTNAPTERRALESLIANKNLGGLKTKSVPFFPTKTLMVTDPNNLSIYYQEGSRRRTIVDNAKRDQIEDYQSVNEAYVVEDLGACAILEGILVPNAAGDAWV
jgi:P2 family phage major capsid protein